MTPYRIKLAETDAEREQIHALNYATFVEEIPQHVANARRRLVDRFDAENTYVIGVDASGTVLGMLALRARRPFSLDQKLANLDDYLPPHGSACELRLLAVRPALRGTRLLRDLLAFAARRAVQDGHDLGLISGTTRQLDLYAHLGCVPFGPLVGVEGARYQPMYLTLEAFVARGGKALGLGAGGVAAPVHKPAQFLPGPVMPHPAVRESLRQAAVSHRGQEFLELANRARRRLCEMTAAQDAALLLGSGTLANEVVAQALRGLGRRGVVLANGEFGERLIDQAGRAGLQFEPLSRPWGEPFRDEEIRAALRATGADWLWAVHCETSTGVVNDLDMLKRIAAATRCALCVDCMSTLGNLPFDMRGVRLATASSAKGLAAYAGIGIVLLGAAAPEPAPCTPSYLDLSVWLAHRSAPFTHSSNLIAALCAALEHCDVGRQHAQALRDTRWLRDALRASGIEVLAPDACASPAITTLCVPRDVPSLALATAMEGAGYELSARSQYLVRRNWVQVALMGAYDRAALRALPDALLQALAACRARQDRAA